MEAELDAVPAPPPLPPGYAWVPWAEALAEAHAEVLLGSFCGGIDAVVFPSLGDPLGCRCLMGEISRKPGFLPAATWLVAGPGGYAASVQGVHDRGVGAIQNLGVLPGHRGRGVGEALLLKALAGFRAAGLGRAMLEVTAQNDPAVRLYRRLGFRRRKVLYRAVDVTALV
jgi:GNAT superfamily N-acetyltransferase